MRKIFPKNEIVVNFERILRVFWEGAKGWMDPEGRRNRLGGKRRKSALEGLGSKQRVWPLGRSETSINPDKQKGGLKN